MLVTSSSSRAQAIFECIEPVDDSLAPASTASTRACKFCAHKLPHSNSNELCLIAHNELLYTSCHKLICGDIGLKSLVASRSIMRVSVPARVLFKFCTTHNCKNFFKETSLARSLAHRSSQEFALLPTVCTFTNLAYTAAAVLTVFAAITC